MAKHFNLDLTPDIKFYRFIEFFMNKNLKHLIGFFRNKVINYISIKVLKKNNNKIRRLNKSV